MSKRWRVQTRNEIPSHVSVPDITRARNDSLKSFPVALSTAAIPTSPVEHMFLMAASYHPTAPCRRLLNRQRLNRSHHEPFQDVVGIDVVGINIGVYFIDIVVFDMGSDNAVQQ
jgi:hypothetical protein